MVWTDGDWKIFAVGLAIGGKYNHTHGTLPKVKSTLPSGSYGEVVSFTLFCDLPGVTIMYSIDGNTPTTVYAGETITIDTEQTLVCYAYAIYKQGLSAMSRFTYVVDFPDFGVSDTLSGVVTLADPVAVELINDDVMEIAEALDGVVVLSDDVEITLT